MLVDADPQGTARDWYAAGQEQASRPPVVALDRPELLLSSIKSINADFLIIDTPAKIGKMSASAVKVADIALIPLQPSPADLWATASAVQLVQAKRDVGGLIEVAFVPTRVIANTKMGKEFLAGEWNIYGIDMFDASIANRIAFVDALSSGSSIFETEDRKGQQEILSLVEEMEAAKWL